MNITVILCTYNRSESLRHALTSAASLKLPESVEWEVLVVDNNSSDKTRTVVDEFRREYPGRFRYLLEPKPGKSQALNAGIREARGDVLAFMDDDVIVDAMWLQKLTAPLLSRESVGAGGRVLQHWTSSVPPWLCRDGQYKEMAWPLVIFDLGDYVHHLTNNVCGTNMAFHKDMFEKYGGFRTDLGPQPGSEIRCEDSEFCVRLVTAGERIRYEPSAIVYHPVPHVRLTKTYFLAWWFDFGRANVRKASPRPAVWGISGRYVRMAGTASRLLRRALRWMLAFTPPQRFYYKVRSWEAAGALVEDCQSLLGAMPRRRWLANSSHATGSANSHL